MQSPLIELKSIKPGWTSSPNGSERPADAQKGKRAIKRYKIYDEDLLNMDNIIAAIETSVKNKKRDKAVYRQVYKNRRYYARRIRWMLKTGRFVPQKKAPFKRRDPCNGKIREIDSTPFYPDQIIHTLLIQQAKPYILKGMIEHCCACVPGRGPHYGKRFIQKWAREPKKKYFIKLDIKKYYPSVKPEIAEQAIKRRFKKSLWRSTILNIIRAYDRLPIGLLTSQWTANLILERTDHYAKEQLHIPHYLRCMDDILIMGTNKRQLVKQAQALIAYLHDNLHLTVKPNWNIHRFDYIDKTGRRRGKPIDMLGFRFYADHTTVRRSVFKRIRRRCLRYGTRNPTPHTSAALLSSYGWLKATDSHTAYKRYMQPHFRTAKGVIRRHADTEQPQAQRP